MAADVFAFYTTVAMGLFTVLSIILGYVLLNSAIVNAARGSAYYAYVRITDAIGNSIYSGSSSLANINIYPRYVIFSAYFDSLSDLEYDVMEGMRVFSYGVNDKNFNNILNDIIASATGESYSNANDPLRVELNKCVGDVCICFGEMESALNLQPEYLNPAACVDICWGEFPGEYQNSLIGKKTQTPKAALNAVNNELAGSNPQSKCAACVNYITSQGYSVFKSQGYNVIVTNSFNPNANNINNFEKLREFSHATKFSFVPNVIECRPMKEIAGSSGKTLADNSPHLFLFEINSTQKGLFALLGTQDKSLIFKVFSLEYDYDSLVNTKKSVVKTSFIKAEPLTDNSIFGGNAI